MAGHSASMTGVPTAEVRPGDPTAEEEPARPAVGPKAAASKLESFVALYDLHFDFVWRSLRRLGVRQASLDDAAQDVFVVVHRRLGDFEGRSSVKTWLFGIAIRVARDHRRTELRKGGHDPLRPGLADRSPGPAEQAEANEARRTLDALLGQLDDDKRAVFILAELEQMTAVEVAEAVSANLNTVYSRLRAARREFELLLRRHQERSR